MVAREFKAKIVDDFETKWFEYTASNEDITVSMAREYYDGEDFQKFAKRISGKIVTLTENIYSIGSIDYFEKIDNNYVMYPVTWKEEKE